MKKEHAVAACLVFIIAGLSIWAVSENIIQFGSFPQRKVENLDNYQEILSYYKGISKENIQKIVQNKPENFGTQSISIHILQELPEETGAANAVTGILWDYRGYDTLGEATVIFVAVASVAALFRARGEEEE